jgi:hypothetical protein
VKTDLAPPSSSNTNVQPAPDRRETGATGKPQNRIINQIEEAGTAQASQTRHKPYTNTPKPPLAGSPTPMALNPHNAKHSSYLISSTSCPQGGASRASAACSTNQLEPRVAQALLWNFDGRPSGLLKLLAKGQAYDHKWPVI